MAFDFSTNNFGLSFNQLLKTIKQRVNYHEPNFVMEADSSAESPIKSLYLLANTYNG
jgi:hypothetical protein